MSPLIEVTGWTLIHFVWQGTLLALATAAALGACRRSAADIRYAIACLGLTAMLATAAATAVMGTLPGKTAFPSGAQLAQASRTGASIEASVGAEGTQPSAASQAGPRAASSSPLLAIVVWIWLAGVTSLIARLAAGCWRVHRLRAATIAAPLSSWQLTAERLARRLRVGVPFRIVESAVVDTPILIGWLQPLIILPLAAMAHMTAAQVEALLAHELAHIRRRDYAINLLQTIAEALLFFHPAVWWISKRIRQEREHCCDDAAIAVAGEATAYAEALMALASWRQRELQPSLGAAKGPLVLRVRRLLSLADEHQPSVRGGLMLLGTGVTLAAAVMVLAAVSSATAQDAARAEGADRRIRQTDHFEVSYTPSLDLHAERISAEAEHAYERVSGDLRHSLGFKIPLVLFESAADLQGGRQRARRMSPLPPAVTDRILFRVDVAADQWLGLLTHEVAHVFAFDILPGSATPAWIAEGLAEYERNAWDPSDLVLLREAVRSNTLPQLTSFQPDASRARFVEALGHAAFDFIESRWGKAGIRQFLLALRRSASGGADPYDAAFRMAAADFDRAFESYLRARLPGSGVAAATPREPAARSTVQLDGVIIATGVPAARNLACIELMVTAASGADERWGIECGDAPAADVISALKLGQRVVITGTPVVSWSPHRLVIRSLVRQSDGYVWRLPG